MKLYEEIENQLKDGQKVLCLELVTVETEIGLDSYVLEEDEIEKAEEILEEENKRNQDKKFKWILVEYTYKENKGLECM